MFFKSVSKMLSHVQKSKVTINLIEGNIASGKSTILDHISSKDNKKFQCLQEPISEWTNMRDGTDLLRLFYEEKDKWTFAFENFVLLSRLKSLYQVEKISQNELITSKNQSFFLERSILSSFNVFALNSFEENKLNQIEYDILNEFYNFYYESIFRNQEKNKNKLFKIIYIRTNPEICFERIRKRNRESENHITLDYLIKINDKYENWINRILTDKSFHVEIVDGNSSLECVILQIEQLFFQ
ncbi:deoxycytidine kinase [Brachionus plicatilis]|uniref:Deoxycytidine kinase n=1 Tax=Brachionus plicatilis TaxID=10195 RepID=A0A3M7T625_BRAPC|nr:deoxycytidine kinase [Brachionus plicatilis]